MQDLAGSGRGLEPSRHVHRVAGHDPLPGGHVAGHDRPGVDPRSPLDRDATLGADLRLELGEPAPDLDGRAARPQRVVLVHRRHPEDRHHRIADELLDRPAVRLDRLAHGVEVAGHDRPHRLGVHSLPERSRRDRVDEENRHRLAGLASRLRLRPDGASARVAEPRPVRVLGPAAGAGGHLSHRAAQ